MSKFIVWADGRKDEAKVISATDMPEAIEAAAASFCVEESMVNIIFEANRGMADYYGVSHAE